VWVVAKVVLVVVVVLLLVVVLVVVDGYRMVFLVLLIQLLQNVF
jgi:hypothetical protein